jgi:hypothetical protein
MIIDEGQDLGFSESLGATFLAGPVMSSLWDAADGGTAVQAAAKKKKAPAKKPSKKPRPKPTKGPGCATKKVDSCTANC